MGGCHLAYFEGALPYAPFGRRILRVGAVGTDVKVLQVLLARTGLFGRLTPDGALGPDTAAALAALRVRYGLGPGEHADAAVFVALGQVASGEGPAFGSRPLQPGAEGEDVQVLQSRLCNHQPFARLLGHAPDGRFDSATQDAVRAFQRMVGAQLDPGLAADGVVGPETLDVLWAYGSWGGRSLGPDTGAGVDALFCTLALFPHLGWELRFHDRGGPRLGAAIAAFQRQAGLVADGVAGPETFWHLGLRHATYPPLLNGPVPGGLCGEAL